MATTIALAKSMPNSKDNDDRLYFISELTAICKRKVSGFTCLAISS